MNKLLADLRQFLVTCSGEDNGILKRCSHSIQNRFALLGMFVVLIFAGCLASAAFFTYSLFDSARWLSIPLGVIWGAVIVNLYLLLLHTVSPPIIPMTVKNAKNRSNKLPGLFKGFTLSMASRIGFILLLAVIIAQPLSVFFLSPSIEDLIESRKIEQRVQLYTLSNHRLIHQEIKDNQNFISKLSSKLSVQEQDHVFNQLDLLKSKIAEDKIFLNRSLSGISRLKSLNAKSENPKIITEKQQLIAQLNIMLDRELQSDHEFLKSLEGIVVSKGIASEFDEYKTELARLITQKIDNYNALVSLLARSNFYISKIQLLLQYNYWSWIISALICLLFILPIYFKYKARTLSANLFSKEVHSAQIKRLRNELISTRDYNWLKNNLMKLNPDKLDTSDYYFKRMLIEHKIIIEQYEYTKVAYSQILSEKIKKYNNECMSRLLAMMLKLKNRVPDTYNRIFEKLHLEYNDLIVEKFEYWIDSPFRTLRKPSPFAAKNEEKALLQFLYDNDENTE